MEELENGMIRVYEDHTGRFYKDYTHEEYDAMIQAYNNDLLMQTLHEEIRKEIFLEIEKSIKNRE